MQAHFSTRRHSLWSWSFCLAAVSVLSLFLGACRDNEPSQSTAAKSEDVPLHPVEIMRPPAIEGLATGMTDSAGQPLVVQARLVMQRKNPIAAPVLAMISINFTKAYI